MTATTTQKPHITTLDPDAGKAGDPIQIVGVHLGTATTATFKPDNGTPVGSPVRVINDGEVATSVPQGLTPGGGTVTVTTKGGTSNPEDFAILPS